MVNRVRLWLRSVVFRRRLEREMRAEMAQHIERATTRLMERGLSAEEADRLARLEFGNEVWLREEARIARGTAWLDALAADARFALRHFARRPGLTATMLVVLVGGMSISTLLFSYVHSYAAMPPAGITLADDMVRIRGSRSAGADGRGFRTFTEEELRAYRALDSHFAGVAGWTDAVVVFDAGNDAARQGLAARATFVTENYFSVLGVRPIAGQNLMPDAWSDPSLAGIAVLGHAAWDQLYGRDPDVIGSTIGVNGVPVTVVGVAPERFIGVSGSSRFQVWLPLPFRPQLLSEARGEYRAAARLRPGVDLREATAAVEVVASRVTAHDETLRGLDPSAEVVPLLSASGDPMFERDVRLLYIWVGLFGVLVLLVTCTNVSGLLMGLASARRQEIAVRLSLGAARTRILRQLLTESAFLASLAAAIALGGVWLLLRTATRLIPGIPFAIGITWPATAFTFGVALAVGVLFGLSPALHATRLGLATAMRDSTGTLAGVRGRVQRGLVVAQVAFTQPLIVLLASVLVLVLGEFQPVNGSPSADRVVAVTVSPSAPITGSAAAAAEVRGQMQSAMRRLRDRLREAPGVEAAVMRWTDVSPIGAWIAHPGDRVDGVRQEALQLATTTVAPGHFDVLDIPIVRGRGFESTDPAGATSPNTEQPVIIGADLAQRVWGGADAVGRRLQAASDTASGVRTFLVVGIVDDPLAETRRAGDDYRVYVPADSARPSFALLLRTTGPADAVMPQLREVARDEIADQIVNMRTLASIEEQQRRGFRLITGGLSAAGMIALLLSALGLYAVVAFSVTQRSGEIAVRLAFGARSGQIARRYVGDGLRLGLFGLAFGLPASLLGLYTLTRAVNDLPDVALPPVTAIAAIGVILVAIAAAWIPARRAAGVDPAVTLRGE